MLKANREQINAFRLASHHLAQRLPAGSLLIAAGACGLQNTPPSSATLAMHARVAGLLHTEVEHSLIEEKTLLQVWSLRAAPYIFPTSDQAIFTIGLLPLEEAEIRGFLPGVEPALQKIGVSAIELIERTKAALSIELDGQSLTKDQLGIKIANRIEPDLSAEQQSHWRSHSWYAPGQSLGESAVRFALPVAALSGQICHTVRRGAQAYLARTDQWLGAEVPGQPREVAQTELIRRYLHCYGPSTPNHFSAWAGISLIQAAQVWKLIIAELVEVEYNGHSTWLLAQDLPGLLAPADPMGIRFLPPHDPYLTARDRHSILPNQGKHVLVWRASGNPGVVLVNGQVIALWRPQKRNKTLTLKVQPFEWLSTDIRSEISAAAEDLASLRGCEGTRVEFMEGHS